MASREEDKAMAGLLRRTLASDAAGVEGQDCPAPQVLAAYFDRALGVDETTRYDLHFSQCSLCREQLAAMARASGADSGEKEAASGWNWLRTPRWLMPTAAASAVLVLIAGITLYNWKSVEVANEVTMLRPDAVPLAAPESPAAASAAPSESSAPATSASGAAEPKNQMLSGDLARSKAAEEMYLRVLPSPAQKKQASAAQGTREKKAPVAPAADSISSAENRMTAQAPPARNAQGLDIAPIARNSAALAPQEETKQRGAGRGKTSARPAASAPAAAAAPSVTGSSFVSRNGRDAAERARIQQAQLSSNLMAGFVVQTPDTNVLWLVSDSGSVGRSEDGGASWKYQPLETHDHFVAGSAPTVRICWLVGVHGEILRTIDGKTWATVQPPVVANFEGFAGIEATGESSATVATADGRRFSTTDGGKTWDVAK
jgi:Photosynthesis system II assembly factor YCF48